MGMVWIVNKMSYRISICFELLLVLLYLSKCIVYPIHSPLDLVVDSGDLALEDVIVGVFTSVANLRKKM